MASVKIEIELRCNVCDSVLKSTTASTDMDGVFAYVEPCPKCCTPVRAPDENPATWVFEKGKIVPPTISG